MATERDDTDDDERDDLDDFIAESEREDPAFAALVEAALQRRQAARARTVQGAVEQEDCDDASADEAIAAAQKPA